jgi:hypothetical protein
MTATDFEIHYSDDGSDAIDWDMVDVKGWLGGVRVEFEQEAFRLNFCDATSNEQDVHRNIEQHGFSFDTDVIVLDRVTRENVGEAIRALASRGFRDLR